METAEIDRSCSSCEETRERKRGHMIWSVAFPKTNWQGLKVGGQPEEAMQNRENVNKSFVSFLYKSNRPCHGFRRHLDE